MALRFRNRNKWIAFGDVKPMRTEIEGTAEGCSVGRCAAAYAVTRLEDDAFQSGGSQHLARSDAGCARSNDRDIDVGRNPVRTMRRLTGTSIRS